MWDGFLIVCVGSCHCATLHVSKVVKTILYTYQAVFFNCIYMQIHMHVHHRVPLIFLVGMEEGYRVKEYTSFLFCVVRFLFGSFFDTSSYLCLLTLPTVKLPTTYVDHVLPRCFA